MINKIDYLGLDFANKKDQTKISEVLLTIIKDYNYVLNLCNIINISDEKILKINRNHLNHDYYTDIITFDLSDNPKEINAELYISIDRIKDNANTLNIKEKTEYTRVCIHGILHLVGHNDKEKEDKKTMTDKENKYLSLL